MISHFGKPRILIFIGSLRAGGKERRLIELLTYLKEKNCFEILVVMTRNEIHYPEFFRLDIDVRIIKKRLKTKDFSVFFEFYKICRQFNPDIIHTWGRMQSLYAVPVVIGQKRLLINSQITGAPSRLQSLSVDRIIDKLNFRFSKLILSNSKRGFEVYGPPHNKQKLILNGINPTRFENLPPVTQVKKNYGIATPHVVIMLASFTPAKDYDLFFNLALAVTSTRDDISFIGVGGYDQDDSGFKRLCRLSAGHQNIFFHGETKEAEALINACTIGVLFSTNGEGTSNTILEYMALGKPVIANNAGGTSELIRNGANGYLVNNEDVNEIAGLIIRLIDDPVLSAGFGQRSIKRIKDEFSVSVMGRAFESMYHEALASKNINEQISGSVLTHKS